MRQLALTLVLFSHLAVVETHGGVTFRETVDTIEVTIDGKPFTTYRHGSGVSKPFFWPIAGPYGSPVTRAYPNVPDAPEESRDHPWHRGLSFTHGEVGIAGEEPVDFWRENAARQGRIVHRQFAPRPEVKDGVLTFGTIDDWIGPDGTKLVEDHVLWRIEDLGEGSTLISFNDSAGRRGTPGALRGLGGGEFCGPGRDEHGREVGNNRPPIEGTAREDH